MFPLFFLELARPCSVNPRRDDREFSCEVIHVVSFLCIFPHPRHYGFFAREVTLFGLYDNFDRLVFALFTSTVRIIHMHYDPHAKEMTTLWTWGMILLPLSRVKCVFTTTLTSQGPAPTASPKFAKIKIDLCHVVCMLSAYVIPIISSTEFSCDHYDFDAREMTLFVDLGNDSFDIC